MKPEIGICLIGAGRAGMIHAKNFMATVPRAGITAVSDPFGEAREAAMRELGVRSVMRIPGSAAGSERGCRYHSDADQMA